MLMFCKNCGKEIDGNFCQNCGCPVSETILNKTVQTKKRSKLPVKRLVLTASILIILSVVVLTVERITNYQRNTWLSDVTINGVALTKEQLDFIDENYILRCSEHEELTDGKLEDLNFEQSERQSDIVPGMEYHSTDIPTCDVLQVDSVSLSVTQNLATSYSVLYSPVKITDENLKKVLEVYAVLLGDEFKCDEVSYTLDALLKNPLPQDGSVVYSNTTSPKGGTHISLSLFVNQNGYAELDVMYLFPEAVEVQ